MKYRRSMLQHKAPARHRFRSTKLLLPHPNGLLLDNRSFLSVPGLIWLLSVFGLFLIVPDYEKKLNYDLT